jgi:hypothetical protein
MFNSPSSLSCFHNASAPQRLTAKEQQRKEPSLTLKPQLNE